MPFYPCFQPVRYRYLLLGILLNISAIQSSLEGQSTAPPPVIVEQVIETEMSTGYRVVGNVEPLRSSTIGAAVAGRVSKFEVEIGERVENGQPLAQLRTDTLKIERAAAQAQLELYQQELAELENGSLPEEIEQAEAIAAGAQAAMENAAAQLQRLVSLSNSRAATEVDLENARERAATTKYAYAAADAALRRIRQGPRIEQIAQRRAQVKLQELQIQLIEDRIEKHTIRAPFDGYISAEYSEIGAWIGGGDPLVDIIELDRVEVRAPVTAEYATRLQIGDTVRVEFPQLPDKLLVGSVDRIAPIADARARTFPIFVQLENELRSGEVPLLLAGMLSRVEFAAGSKEVLPLVPKDALVLNQGTRSVFLVQPDSATANVGTVRKVSVDLGVAMNNLIQVHGDLTAGQLVVVVGNERLASGDKVRIVMNESLRQPEG